MCVLGLYDFRENAAFEQGVRRDGLIKGLQVGRVQNFVGNDSVEDGAFLSGVEIEAPCKTKVFEKPPAQQVCRNRRDLFVYRGAAVFQSPAKFLCLRGQCGSERHGRRRVRVHAVASTVATASASKPNTSTARTQIRRVPFLRATSRFASVTTRNGSPSFSTLPR